VSLRTALRHARILLAAAVVVLGIALLAVTVARGGGETGVVLGVLFVAAGAGRLYLMRGR
jgi:hypothetical protein